MRTSAEHFDTETLALLSEIEVPIPDFTVDLDIIFGTPLEMHEPWATPREAKLRTEAIVPEFFARRYAARDILADDPTITAFVRERLVDILLPHAAQLRIAPPAAAPLSIAA